jgi:Electron transfer DM13
MTILTNAWLLRWKWTVVGVGLLVLLALWWAFRPEKLWINEKVNEPAPFDSSADPQPVFTGRFESKTEQTSGRATVYKKSGGAEYLRLSDFKGPNAPDVHAALVRTSDLDPIDLGPLKTDQGDQSYDLPGGTDLKQFSAVAIFTPHPYTVFGLAKLEPF